MLMNLCSLEETMADTFKLLMLFFFIFFLVANSKAVKPTIDEGVADSNDFSNGPQYSLVLPGKKSTYN